jgi:hypothetical protein
MLSDITQKGLKVRLLNFVIKDNSGKSAASNMKPDARCVVEAARKMLPRINVIPADMEAS